MPSATEVLDGLSAIANQATGRIGVAMVAFGGLYLHFLEGQATAYLYASPVGLVPCPTLAVAIGFALVGNGLGSRVWSLTLVTVVLHSAGGGRAEQVYQRRSDSDRAV